jgi:predicted nucleic acid-binding protein
MSTYWDTSCILKLYCFESDSKKFHNMVERYSSALTTSSLTDTEMYYALLQKESRSETGDEAANEIFQRYLNDSKSGLILHIPLGEDIFRITREITDICYKAASPIQLRSLDGLHLAAALHSGCTQLVSADLRMKAAAQLIGLPVLETGSL